MKKKSVKRKAVGGLMGALADSGIKAPVGIIPQMIYKNRKDSKAASVPAAQQTPTTMPSGPMQRPQVPTRGMRKGGKIDGCAMRGKTKGTMR